MDHKNGFDSVTFNLTLSRAPRLATYKGKFKKRRFSSIQKDTYIYIPQGNCSKSFTYEIRIMPRIFRTDGSGTTILIRSMVGIVFLSEGIQKFLFPAVHSAGRFDKMGFPDPEIFANLVGTLEILCALLLLHGLLTRAAALVMLINISVAITVTKISVAMGKDLALLRCANLKTMVFGAWSMRL